MRLSLATKIFLVFSALLGIFGVVSFFSVLEIRAVGEDLRTIKDHHLALARHAAKLETHQENRFRELRRCLDQETPSARLRFARIARQYFPGVIRSTTEEIREVAARQVERAAQNGDADDRRAFAEELNAHLDRIAEYHKGFDELTEQIEALGEEDIDTTAARERLEAIWSRVRSETYRLDNHIGDDTERAVRSAATRENRAILRIAVMTAVSLVIGILLMVISTRSLSPIKKLVLYARAISRGDYQQATPATSGGELTALADELSQMARSRKDREDELDRQADELEEAYRRVEELKRYHQSIVRSLRTGVVVTDRSLTVTSANRAAVQHWGLEGVTGGALDATPLGAALAERLGPMNTYVERVETVTTDALALQSYLADVTIAPLENERGAVLGLVIALEDVTEAVRTKEALIRSERLATIGRMSAHVTHEIRNPLSSIGLNAEMLEDMALHLGDDAEDAKSMCRSIAREVDRLTAITDAYLKFARLPRPEPAEADLSSWLQTIGAFVRRDLDAANVSLVLSLPDEAPTVSFDPDQMRQAMLNLIRNAKESMPEGGEIRVTATIEGAWLRLEVQDEGVGIPTEHLDRVFDPFYSTKLTGTGLGLALTQQIIQEHGGQLALHSEMGVGTTFSITLPVSQQREMTHVLDGDVREAATGT
ncbi:MAG: ATP-binding protein [Deltaproteobacteria bacterium]